MKDFKDKILFVTGGASGAGLGQAKVFSEAGCKVVIADVRQDHLEQAAAYFREKNAPVHTINLDITDRAAYAALKPPPTTITIGSWGFALEAWSTAWSPSCPG